MAVYDKNGATLSSVYSKSGSISTAYDLHGNVIFGGGIDYTDYSITDLFRYPQSNMQGFAVYGGKIAQVRENDALHIIDIATQSLLRKVTMDMGHGNSCQFSNEFYATGDEFPLFYIRNDGVWVYRIVDTSSTLIKKYSFPTESIYTYVAGFGIDNENGLFYTASYTQGDYVSKDGQMCICKWDMNNVTQNQDGTYTMSLLARNTFDWFTRYNAVQGCCFHDGYFFISSGYTGRTQQDIVLVDGDTLGIAYTIDIGLGQESEGCGWYGNEFLILGQKENTYTYRKIVFGTS